MRRVTRVFGSGILTIDVFSGVTFDAADFLPPATADTDDRSY